jgi:hypothetical protein
MIRMTRITRMTRRLAWLADSQTRKIADLTDHDTFVYKKGVWIKQVTYIISTDEDPGLRIESFAVLNLRGVSTNKTIIM